MNLPYAYAKICSKCGELKIVHPINYAKHSSAKYGVMPMCKVCKAKYEKERRAKKIGKKVKEDFRMSILVNPEKLLEFMEGKTEEHKIEPLRGVTLEFDESYGEDVVNFITENIGLNRTLFGKNVNYRLADVDINENGDECYWRVDPDNLIQSFMYGAFDAHYQDPEHPIDIKTSVAIIYTKHHLIFVAPVLKITNDVRESTDEVFMCICEYSTENETKLAEILAESEHVETVILLKYTTGIDLEKERYYALEVIPKHFDYISIFDPQTDEVVKTFNSINEACKYLKLNSKAEKEAVKRAIQEESKKFKYIWRATEEDGSY